MGPERASSLLASGCNDMGGSIMNESITRAAGAQALHSDISIQNDALWCQQTIGSMLEPVRLKLWWKTAFSAEHFS